MTSFSWGGSSTNNNNNNNNTTSSNGFSWGNNNNNNNNNNTSSTNNNTSSTNNNTSSTNNNNNTSAWGSTNNNNNNSSFGTSTNNNNSSSSSFAFGSTNNNNNTTSAWGSSTANNNNTPGENSNNNAWGSNNNNNNNNNNSTSFAFGGNNNNNNNNNSNNNTWGNNNNTSNGTLNPNNDYVISDTPTDAITAVQFHPSQPHFIISSWDNSISYYEFFGNNQSKKLGTQKHSKPILDCCYDLQGNNVFSCGCDNIIKQWNPQSNNFRTIGQHKSPIRCIEYNESSNLLISGSWDKCIAFWDIRNNNSTPVYSSNLGSKIYAMSTNGNHLVVGLSDNDIKSFDIRNGSREIHSIKQEAKQNSKAVCLKKQVRCIDIFPKNNGGYVSASIGGRVIIKHFDRSQQTAKTDFSYKCHRQTRNNNNSNIFGVNVIKFHKQSAVFATGGDDGEIVTWDKDGRAKLFTFKCMKINNYNNNFNNNNNNNIDNTRMPIVGLDYHNNGQYMIYATSYNWNKGSEFYDVKQQKPQVYLHQIKQEELDKNKKK